MEFGYYRVVGWLSLYLTDRIPALSFAVPRRANLGKFSKNQKNAEKMNFFVFLERKIGQSNDPGRVDTGLR